MDTPTKIKQPEGNVKANFARILPHDPRYQNMSDAERASNDRQPLLQGVISKPENPDELYQYAVWDYVDPNGTTFLMGTSRPLPTRAGVEEHLNAKPSLGDVANLDPETGEPDPYKLNPHTVVLRENPDKIKKADAAYAGLSDEERKSNANRPYYWGKWQCEPTDREVRISLWDRSGRYGPFLSGNTQYAMTKDELEKLQMAGNVLAKSAPEQTARAAKGDNDLNR